MEAVTQLLHAGTRLRGGRGDLRMCEASSRYLAESLEGFSLGRISRALSGDAA